MSLFKDTDPIFINRGHQCHDSISLINLKQFTVVDLYLRTVQRIHFKSGD